MTAAHRIRLLHFSTQRYHCQQCGRCCRRFLIPISQLEVLAISRLPWPDPADARQKCYTTIGGRTYLKADSKTGECLYLENGTRCRMHATFGSKCKTISCRAYPFEFMRTFGDDISVAARFDCPAIQANQGENLTYYRLELEEILADPLMRRLLPPIAPEQMDGLEQKTIEAIADALRKALLESTAPVQALQKTIQRLRQLGPVFANDRETLAQVLPSMIAKAVKEVGDAPPVIGILWPERAALRKMLLEHIRFDRQLPDFSLGARLKSMRLSAQFLWGYGNPRSFGPEQPDVALHHAKLFDNDSWEYAPDAWECYRRFLAVRLESRQFFAAAYYGKGFYDGLLALLGTWPLAVTLARLHGSACHSGHVDAADVAYATGLLDHNHGRRIRLK